MIRENNPKSYDNWFAKYSVSKSNFQNVKIFHFGFGDFGKTATIFQDKFPKRRKVA